jgi:hypothetical protein
MIMAAPEIESAEAITAADSRYCQDGCALATLGRGQWLIRRWSFLPAEGV